MNALKNHIYLKQNHQSFYRRITQLTVAGGIIYSVCAQTQKALADELEAHVEIGGAYNMSENAWGSYLHSSFIIVGEHDGGHIGIGPGIAFHCGNQLPSVDFTITKPQSLLVCEGHLEGGIEASFGFKPKRNITIAPYFEMGAGISMLWHGDGFVGYKNDGTDLFAEENQQIFPMATIGIGIAWQYKNFGIVTGVEIESPMTEIRDGINGPGITPEASINLDWIIETGLIVELE